ncbi:MULTISPECIES: aldo/keto reductase [Vibrio]|uniref:aldo/keto reductase n=1 Tax=Vibrio TaxID=662 RepID=UPI001B82CBF1|nr:MULTISPECIES: aldo/keto reductase [Vibrio]EJE4170888.1 aldo/keto reductase [Vibrio parahaemolyticus]MDF4934628.1 aldo/keto reductase [Vibrio parahaemolyticus]BDR17882.1 aldo/keto reductase [Vibrio sp. STUT-A16]HBC3416825.1 aldo/keto reductase [Vibrio parahaemolyticus]HBC3602307.1 aldo/keto reductase [Vibrio parahaemolyticus]
MNNQTLPLTKTLPNVSRLVFGCMGLGGEWSRNPLTMQDEQQSHAAVEAALEVGINLFDHADIYKFGKAEQVFGRILAKEPTLRDRIYLQSKCGIRLGDEQGVKQYDFSAQWVRTSVNGILERLGVEHLDVLMLHRPDPLVEFEELGTALRALKESGKVNHFGVSNMNGAQIELLQQATGESIVANQLEMSLAKSDFIKQGIGLSSTASDYVSGTLEQARKHDIQLQAWGSMAQGRFSERGLHSDDHNTRQTAEVVMSLAAEYGVSSEAIVLAFLTRHPSQIQPVIGTANAPRIRACAQVENVTLSRNHWYGLLEKSLGHEIP